MRVLPSAFFISLHIIDAIFFMLYVFSVKHKFYTISLKNVGQNKYGMS